METTAEEINFVSDFIFGLDKKSISHCQVLDSRGRLHTIWGVKEPSPNIPAAYYQSALFLKRLSP